MSNRPAFLDALADDAVITGSALKKGVTGKSAVVKVVETAGSLYASMTPTFHEQIKNKEFMEYDAILTEGYNLHGVVTLTKNAEGQISHVSVTQSPFDAVVWLSREMGKRLSKDFGPDFFL
jgi:hypothetical protein